MHSKEHHTLSHSASIRPEDWLRFVQIDPFPRMWSQLQLKDEDLRALEIGIMASPAGYVVIPGTGGMRKLRFSTPDSGRGKRGSYRVYYVYLADYGTVLLMAILSKGEKADLSKADKNALATVIARLKSLLERGAIR